MSADQRHEKETCCRCRHHLASYLARECQATTNNGAEASAALAVDIAFPRCTQSRRGGGHCPRAHTWRPSGVSVMISMCVDLLRSAKRAHAEGRSRLEESSFSSELMARHQARPHTCPHLRAHVAHTLREARRNGERHARHAPAGSATHPRMRLTSPDPVKCPTTACVSAVACCALTT